MTDTLRRYATPLITGFFLISLVSGIALFFHVGTGTFREMHEWLSMVLVVPFVLHLWRNWRAMMAYVGRTPFTIAMVGSLAAALAFAIPAGDGQGGRGGPPQFALASAVLANTPDTVAPLLGVSGEQLVVTLKSKGFTAATASMPLRDIATQSGKDEFELVAAMLPVGASQ